MIFLRIIGGPETPPFGARGQKSLFLVNKLPNGQRKRKKSLYRVVGIKKILNFYCQTFVPVAFP